MADIWKNPLKTPSGAETTAYPREAVTALEEQLEKCTVRYEALRREMAGRERDHADALDALLLEVIEGLDALDAVFDNIAGRPAEAPAQVGAWLNHFESVRALYGQVLVHHHVERIPDVAGLFDSERQRAVAADIRDDVPPGRSTGIQPRWTHSTQAGSSRRAAVEPGKNHAKGDWN